MLSWAHDANSNNTIKETIYLHTFYKNIYVLIYKLVFTINSRDRIAWYIVPLLSNSECT